MRWNKTQNRSCKRGLAAATFADKPEGSTAIKRQAHPLDRLDPSTL